MPRLSKFNEQNEYYVPSGKFNIYAAKDDINLPNCTMYCFLRAHEALSLVERDRFLIRPAGGFGTAKQWFNQTSLPKGYELREGAIAVFDGNSGHVAFVEKKINNNHGTISESDYTSNKSVRDWHYWNLRENVELTVGKATISGVGKLIGYIYLPVDDIRVARDITKLQVNIKEDKVNVRIDPSLSAPLFDQGCYIAPGIYNVIGTREADGYTWVKVEHDHWIACGNWAEIYEVPTTPDPEPTDNTSELKNQIKELKAENKELTATNKSLSSEVESVKKELTARNNLIDSVRVQVKNINNLLNIK